jgi:hypothetical protein
MLVIVHGQKILMIYQIGLKLVIIEWLKVGEEEFYEFYELG